MYLYTTHNTYEEDNDYSGVGYKVVKVKMNGRLVSLAMNTPIENTTNIANNPAGDTITNDNCGIYKAGFYILKSKKEAQKIQQYLEPKYQIKIIIIKVRYRNIVAIGHEMPMGKRAVVIVAKQFDIIP